MISANSLVLFQGDSITDVGRSRQDTGPNQWAGLGWGYAGMVAVRMLADRPGQGLSFLNRGISGNRVIDLRDRWQADCLDLKPDLVSIHIGVNDTWHGFAGDRGVSVPEYEKVYRALLHQTRHSLPKVRLVLCEPFLAKVAPVQDAWIEELNQRRAVVRSLAHEFSAAHVPFQALFDVAMKKAPAAYWLADGVHPSLPGHDLMARKWLEVVEQEVG